MMAFLPATKILFRRGVSSSLRNLRAVGSIPGVVVIPTRCFCSTPPQNEEDEFDMIMNKRREKGFSRAKRIIEEAKSKNIRPTDVEIEHSEGEEEEIYEYLPPRELRFNHMGEMVLFNNKNYVQQRKLSRQIPFTIATGIFTYLIIVNLNRFSFDTATFGTYAKLVGMWLFGFTPSFYIMRMMGKASRSIVTEMKLMENGQEVKFTTYKGREYHVKIKDILPLMDEKIILAQSNPNRNTLFFQFFVNGEMFMIDGLDKTNPNIDIVQSVIHGIHITRQ
jgi:hypothetical protein